MRKFTQQEFDNVMDLHRKWLKDEEGGKRLNLSNKRIELDFSGINFSRSNFSGSNFSGSDFSGSNLDFITNENTSFLRIQCPEVGAFVGFKKCHGKIVTLQITKNAKRSSATSRKCRCSEAKVLEIEGGLSEISSNRDNNFIYRVGKTVKVNDFDENRMNECSTGIHFFITKIEAQQYI